MTGTRVKCLWGCMSAVPDPDPVPDPDFLIVSSRLQAEE
jgi:hypothetical protein